MSSGPSDRSSPTKPPVEPHAVTRARERFGLELTQADLGEIARLALADKASLTGITIEGHEVRFVRFKGVPMRAVINPKTRRVVTLLRVRFKVPKRRHKILYRKEFNVPAWE